MYNQGVALVRPRSGLHDISPEWHLKMQAAFQENIDNAVTKTVNLPNNSSVLDVEEIYRTAWKLNCKGVTIYRDGARTKQAIEFSSKIEEKSKTLGGQVVCETCDS